MDDGAILQYKGLAKTDFSCQPAEGTCTPFGIDVGAQKCRPYCRNKSSVKEHSLQPGAKLVTDKKHQLPHHSWQVLDSEKQQCVG